MYIEREREVHTICISYIRREQRSQTRRRWKTCLGDKICIFIDMNIYIYNV